MGVDSNYGELYERRPQRKNTLRVSFLGGFSMDWNECFLTGSAKSTETQFTYLMEMILFSPEGVTREELEKFLFGDRDVDNAHHALQSVVYNAKKRLQSCGLPDVKYIIQDKGVFRWTTEIPLLSDVREFKKLAARANREKDAEQKIRLYLQACSWYSGEFLPNQAGVIWVAQESRRCRSLFCECVEQAARLMRERKEFAAMEALGVYATNVDPLADWETVIMDSFVSRGMFEDARKLYDDTVQYYLKKQGLRPSPQLMEIFQRLGDQMQHRHKVLDTIQAELAEGDGNEGGYFCTYPVFRGIYRAVSRMMERGGQSVYLMLCTLVDAKGNPIEDGPALDELSLRLKVALCSAVRRTDVVNQYGRGQFLALLVNLTLEDCKTVQKRVSREFREGRQRTSVQYYVNSVILPANDIPKGDRKEQEE